MRMKGAGKILLDAIMEFNINEIISKNFWAILVAIFGAYGFIIKLGFKTKENTEDINCIRNKEIEAVKQFNDERYGKLERKIDKMFDTIDNVKETVNHMSGYLMGIKDKEGN